VNPQAAQAQLALGGYYQSRSRFAEAEQQFRHAMDLDPKDPDPPAALARLYIAQGKKAEAEAFLKQVKPQFPDNSTGYRMLGDFYFATGDLDKVEATARQAFTVAEEADDAVAAAHALADLWLTHSVRRDHAAALDYLDQAGLGENGHVMRDGGLGEAHTLFDVAGAEPRVLGDRGRACGRRAALFESPQDAAARGIGNGVQRAVERCGRSHGD